MNYHSINVTLEEKQRALDIASIHMIQITFGTSEFKLAVGSQPNNDNYITTVGVYAQTKLQAEQFERAFHGQRLIW